METLPTGLPKQVDNEEELARFLTSSSYSNAKGVKPVAFLPRPDDSTSVFRHGSVPLDGLWQISDSYLPRVRKIYGVAIVKAVKVREALLDVVGEEPPPLHANIIGWPMVDDDPEEQIAQQKKRAAVIAQHAELVMREST